MAIVEIVVCLNCDTGVYMRAQGDVRECNCGNVHIDDEGVYVKVGDAYRVERNVVLKKTTEQLEKDFAECVDKFGIIKSAVKMIEHLRKTDRKVVFTPRRRFDDDVEGMLSLEA